MAFRGGEQFAGILQKKNHWFRSDNRVVINELLGQCSLDRKRK